uniref:long-chain-fatty-acid--CoA ligase n=1 Tax=Macrostomum lignano TaxID=282301 RepID=A0A1I8F2E6_9PLAT
ASRSARNGGLPDRALGLTRGSFVGTFSSNSASLVVLELACYSSGLVIVPLYDTLGREACSHILQETQLSVAFCRSTKQAATVSELGSAEQAIRLIVAEPSEAEQPAGAAVISYVDAIAKGRELLQQRREGRRRTAVRAAAEDADANRRPQPSDLAVICYTSGTTGQPKGVMLTNDNLVKGVHLVTDTIKEDTFKHPVELNSSDRYFSYLPMAHILERMCQLFAFAHGLSMGFFRRDRAGLMDDLRECQPTFMAAVPKSRRLSQLRVDKDTLWDRLVFRRVQEGLGGRVRFVAVGGAPISADTLNFVKAALGCPVVQRPGDPASNHTGRPMLGIEVRLADAPTPTVRMRRLTVAASCGIRGPTCFAGYFKQPERSAETLDSDGWVHTGDIAQLLPGGSYRIVDRVKHLFKLAQGEYIAPEKIELVYCLNPAIDQVFVDGRSERSCLLGVVVPTLDATKAWLAKDPADTAAAAGDSPPELLAAACGSAGFKAHLLGAAAAGQAEGAAELRAGEGHPAAPRAFQRENDLMTPTMKLKRPQLRKRFADAFDAMYAEYDDDDDDMMIMMMMVMIMMMMVMIMMMNGDDHDDDGDDMMNDDDDDHDDVIMMMMVMMIMMMM